MTTTARAMTPEDLTRLFVERANAGDAAGLAALDAEDAVRAFPPGRTTEGRAAIEALWAGVLDGSWLRLIDRPQSA
jgi:ketosteroid isomerase-like protein